MNNELYHWKYIKREKKGDKWVYTYDDGSNAKKNYQQAKSNLDTRNAQERSAYKRNLPGGGVKNAAFNNWTNYAYNDRGIQNKLEKKVDAAEQKYIGSPEQRKEDRQYVVNRAVNSAKKWAKDKLGYDEKQRMESAKTKAMLADRKANDTDLENLAWKRENPDSSNIAYLADWQTNYHKDLAKEARAEADKAVKDFAKTPLGMLERAKDFVDDSEELQEFMRAHTGRTNSLRRYEDAMKKYNEVKSKVDSGEYFDKDRGNYSIIEPYEKEYRKAFQEYTSASERYEKARKEYESTPQYALKRTSDRIKSGRKKASKFFKGH